MVSKDKPWRIGLFRLWPSDRWVGDSVISFPGLQPIGEDGRQLDSSDSLNDGHVQVFEGRIGECFFLEETNVTRRYPSGRPMRIRGGCFIKSVWVNEVNVLRGIGLTWLGFLTLLQVSKTSSCFVTRSLCLPLVFYRTRSKMGCCLPRAAVYATTPLSTGMFWGLPFPLRESMTGPDRVVERLRILLSSSASLYVRDLHGPWTPWRLFAPEGSATFES